MIAAEQVRTAERLVRQIEPLLAGRGPEVQGLIIADLLATFIAGHAPDLREEIFSHTIDLVRRLIPHNGPANPPPEWRPQ